MCMSVQGDRVLRSPAALRRTGRGGATHRSDRKTRLHFLSADLPEGCSLSSPAGQREGGHGERGGTDRPKNSIRDEPVCSRTAMSYIVHSRIVNY